MRRLSVLATTMVLLLGGVACGGRPAEGGTTLSLEPVSSAGADPFTPPAGTNTPNVTPPPNAGGTVAGSTVGLFGGTLNQSTCDPVKLVAFLKAHRDKAHAWATVLGITPNDIPTFVAELTPAILRSDTFVVNHGFANGQATAVPSVLQAGTAVLVDAFGFPVTRCFCGNPLTKPTSFTRVTFVGPQWNNFSSTRITVIQSSTVVVNQFTLVEPGTGVSFDRPRGTDGRRDTHVTKPAPSGAPAPAPSSGSPSSAAPPSAAPPSATAPPSAPPSSAVPPSSVPPSSGAPASPGPPAVAPSSPAVPSPSAPPAPSAPPSASASATPSGSPSASTSGPASASRVVGDCHVADGQLHATVLVRNNDDATTHSYQATVVWGPTDSPFASEDASLPGVAPGETGQATVTAAASPPAPERGPVACEITKLTDETGNQPAEGPALTPPPDTQPSEEPTTEEPTTEPPTTEPPTTEPETSSPSPVPS